MNRKLRMGMVGGGKGAFIGAVHRMAANLDGEIELVCGAFSSDPIKSKESGEELYLPPNRVYGTFEEMILKEKELPEGERMDFISIVTPNHLHFLPAKLALENGFHVVCDKPMTLSLYEAKELEKIVEKTGLLFALTHTYTGYPMVKEARDIVRSGKIGEIRRVVVEYVQGWLATKVEDSGNKQADWRTDPKRSGIALAMGDIGVHAENLAEYITGLKITELCADVTTIVPGRILDDDGQVLLRFNNGAKGLLMASQVCTGEENDLTIKIYGDKGGLKWRQEEPNTILLTHLDKPVEIIRTGGANLSAASKLATRVPSGHPEGYIEAFANIYKYFAKAVRAKLAGKEPQKEYLDFPTVKDGVRGMTFIESVVESSKRSEKWYKVPE